MICQSRNSAIASSIALTLFFTGIASILVSQHIATMLERPYPDWSVLQHTLVFAGVYLLLHPLIGKLLSAITSRLFAGVNGIYELKKPDAWWSTWTGEDIMVWASAWPIVAIPCILVALLAILLGLLFKSLFLWK